ncbi:endonuclease/exonuclease/phosphatase family protein [Terricaulis silvestris]|uniref:Endonuclease/Exonuclease/phosphatase family protein n=1 Tax=Terricaulis silvestris TaxID=2686094 RepID=A0A6I6MPC6_9CAUL|nr:endonuclease/exonuclease/phosphatase family protein [Terricaulis silvestris]QGZ93412.1 Endonuclease/Exonuclease/phosphatase family protein [Terricaulis silvestris]
MGNALGFALGTARLVVGVAALVSAAAGIAIVVEHASPGLETFANFAPFAFVIALLSIALALSVRASRAIVAAAFIGVLAPAWLVVPELVAALHVDSRHAADAPQLKLLTANVWSINDNPAAFEALIRRERPDIIVVQEAWGRWKALLERLAPEYQIHAGCQYDSDCNVVILSKLTPVDTIAPWTAGMAAVRLELPPRFGAGSIEVMGVHLSRSTTVEMERAQLAEVTAIAGSFGSRAVIAGDFNAAPWSRALRDLDEVIPLERRTRALFSWPTSTRSFTRLRLRAPLPVAPIDHIYAGRQWRLIEICLGPNIGSDHYPIVATFVPAPS